MSAQDPRQLAGLEADSEVRYPPLDDLEELLFPDLLPKWSEAEEDAFLRNVEEAGGVQVPIAVDADLNVIDGGRRLRASRKLRLPIPVIICHCRDREVLRHYAVLLNCNRRQMSRDELVKLIEEELRMSPSISLRYLAELCGTNKDLVDRTKKRLIESGAIPKREESIGKFGQKFRFPKMLARNRRERNLVVDSQDKAGELQDWNLPRTVRRKALENEYKKNRTGDIPPNPYEDYKLHSCRFQDLIPQGHVQPGTVNLIYTDPFYHGIHLQDWSDLADFAAEALNEDGLLMAYTGSTDLPEVIRRLEEKLSWVWLATVGYPERQGKPQFQINVAVHHRPVLIFSKRPRYKFPHPISDFCLAATLKEKAARGEKKQHEYQQDLSAAKYFMRQVVRKEMLVCDCCLGSGTFLQGAARTEQGAIARLPLCRLRSRTRLPQASDGKAKRLKVSQGATQNNFHKHRRGQPENQKSRNIPGWACPSSFGFSVFPVFCFSGSG